MSARTVARAAGVLSVAAVVAVAGSAVPAGAAAKRAAVKVQVTAKHRVSSPSSLRPGLVHLTNGGGKSLILVRKKHKGVAGLVAAFNKATDTKGSIAFHKAFDVVDVIASHADEYVRLAAGTYYFADNSTTRIKSVQVRTLAVKGTRINATAPHATLVGTSAGGKVTKSVSLRTNTFVRVVNRSASPHITSIQSIRRGVTARQIRAAIADPAHHNPFDLTGTHFAPLGSTAGHSDLYKRVRAGAGRYFLFTASLTHPGLAKGQIGLLTIK